MQLISEREPLSSDRPAARLPGHTAVSTRRHVRDLYSPSQLDAVLRRERARSDRNACRFAAVCFEIRRRDVTRRDYWRLATILLRLLRETDELGWLDEQTLCAVLPDTSAEGAKTLIARTLTETTDKLHAPSHAIYVYPERHPGPTQKSDPNTLPRQPATFGAARGRNWIDRLTAEVDPAAATVRPAATTPSSTASAPLSPLLAEPLPAWKRVLDVAVSSLAIVLTAPLWLGAMAAIRLSGPGPIFFKQQRTGLGGRPFAIWKFRTMVVDAEKRLTALRALSEQDGPAFKLKNDPRIFWAGRFLRKTSIDELPQLINVLRGEMTLVGPRPLPVHEADACIGWQRRRHDVTPGLTCIWQVEGRSRVKFDEWMRMDRRYARRRSLLRDVGLVLRTIPAVLMRRGAN